MAICPRFPILLYHDCKSLILLFARKVYKYQWSDSMKKAKSALKVHFLINPLSIKYSHNHKTLSIIRPSQIQDAPKGLKNKYKNLSNIGLKSLTI